MACEVCGEPYNYEGTGLCGPCATGEADTYGEGEYVGGEDYDEDDGEHL